MLKRIVAFALLVAALLSLFSCTADKEHRVSELVITVPKNFEVISDNPNADLTLSNGEATIAVTRLSYESESIPGPVTVTVFAEQFIENLGLDATVYKYGDIAYATYYSKSGGASLFSTVAFVRSPYAYFMLLFSTSEAGEGEWRERFLELADGVYFDVG